MPGRECNERKPFNYDLYRQGCQLTRPDVPSEGWMIMSENGRADNGERGGIN